jgi:hypothetical protein
MDLNKQKLLVASLNCVGDLCACDSDNMRNALLKLPNTSLLACGISYINDIFLDNTVGPTIPVLGSYELKNYIEHAIKEVVDNGNDVVMTIYSHIKPISMGSQMRDNEDCFVTSDGSILSESSLMRYLQPLKHKKAGSLTLIVIGCYAESMFDSFKDAPCTIYVSADKDEVTTAGRFTDAFVAFADLTFTPDNIQPFVQQIKTVMNVLFERARAEQWHQKAMLLDKLYYAFDSNEQTKKEGIIPMNVKKIDEEILIDRIKELLGLIDGGNPASAVREAKILDKPYVDIKYRDCLGNEGKITCTPVTLRVMEAAIESLFEVFGTTIMVDGKQISFDQFKIVDSGLKGAA